MTAMSPMLSRGPQSGQLSGRQFCRAAEAGHEHSVRCFERVQPALDLDAHAVRRGDHPRVLGCHAHFVPVSPEYEQRDGQIEHHDGLQRTDNNAVRVGEILLHRGNYASSLSEHPMVV